MKAHTRVPCEDYRAPDSSCNAGTAVHIANCIARLPTTLCTPVPFEDAVWHGPSRQWLRPPNPRSDATGARLVAAGGCSCGLRIDGFAGYAMGLAKSALSGILADATAVKDLGLTLGRSAA